MIETLKTPKVDSTLSKGLTILETLTAVQGSKGVTELSRELGLTKSKHISSFANADHAWICETLRRQDLCRNLKDLADWTPVRSKI